MTIYTIGVDADGDVVINPTKVENTAADIKSKISAIKDNDMEITVVSNDNDEKVDAIFVNNKTFAKLTTVNSTSVSYKPVLLDMKGNIKSSNKYGHIVVGSPARSPREVITPSNPANNNLFIRINL